MQPQINQMPSIQQESFQEGATMNCKDVVIKANHIFSEMGTDKVLKMRRGIEQQFVEVKDQHGKLLTEDWQDTKVIFAEKLYNLYNKFLFDDMDNQRGIFTNQYNFVTKTMKVQTASLNEISIFLINNFFLKELNTIPVSEVPSLTSLVTKKEEVSSEYDGKSEIEEHTAPEENQQEAITEEDYGIDESPKPENDEDQDEEDNSSITESPAEENTLSDQQIVSETIDAIGNKIVTLANGTKFIVQQSQQDNVNRPTDKSVQRRQGYDITVEDVLKMHNYNPIPETHGNEAIVQAHSQNTINNPSNLQNPIEMLKRNTQAPIAATMQQAPVNEEKRLLTNGQKFIGLNYAIHQDENVLSVKETFAEMADFLLDMENKGDLNNDSLLKDLHAHAKQALLSASMSMTRVLTYKK